MLRLIDRPLKTQFLIAAGWVTLWFGATLGVRSAFYTRQSDASRSLLQAHTRVSSLILLQRDFYRQQSAVFGFLETSQPDFLRLVDLGRNLWQNRASGLRESFEPGTAERQAFEKMDRSYLAWRALTQRALSTHHAGRDLGPKDTAREAELSRDVFGTIESLVDFGNREVERWTVIERRWFQRGFASIIVSNLVLLAILAALLVKLYSSIARPVASLSASMARYQDGELGTRVEVTSRSEIGFLQSNFNETARKIERMVRELRNVDELKNEFISTVSHELKTPLTSISGFTRLLSQGDAGTVGATQKEFLGIIETNVRRLSELIGDLLDVERMESGGIPLSKEPVDLRGVLRECRDTVQVVAAEKGLAFKLVLPEAEVVVRGDRPRIVQIFMNLFSNAVKYTATGSVTVSVEPQSFAVIVRVRDTGAGIPENEQARLFEKFFRASSARDSGEGGTGLGLVIVKSLVEAHGGRVSVSSRAGEGSTFTVILPIESPVTTERSEVATFKEIWIVDPQTVHAEALRQAIERDAAGWDFRPVVRVFGSARELPTRGSVPALIATIGDIGGELPVIAPTLDSDSIRPENFSAAVRKIVGRSSKRILVGDSRAEVREKVRRSLELRGFRVDEAGAGSAVLRRIGRDRYDLVVVDPDFSDLGGADLMRSIRRDPRGKALPVFVLMDETQSLASRQALLKLGADQFVGKVEGLGGVADAVTEYLG